MGWPGTGQEHGDGRPVHAADPLEVEERGGQRRAGRAGRHEPVGLARRRRRARPGRSTRPASRARRAPAPRRCRSTGGASTTSSARRARRACRPEQRTGTPERRAPSATVAGPPSAPLASSAITAERAATSESSVASPARRPRARVVAAAAQTRCGRRGEWHCGQCAGRRRDLVLRAALVGARVRLLCLGTAMGRRSLAAARAAAYAERRYSQLQLAELRPARVGRRLVRVVRPGLVQVLAAHRAQPRQSSRQTICGGSASTSASRAQACRSSSSPRRRASSRSSPPPGWSTSRASTSIGALRRPRGSACTGPSSRTAKRSRSA